MNTPKELLNEVDFGLYKLLKWPANIPVLHKALVAKVKEDPDYECWVPLHYQGSRVNRADEEPLCYHNDDFLISSKGRFIRPGIEEAQKGSSRSEGHYLYFMITDTAAGLRNNISVARAVACSFIPIPSKHIGAAYSLLVPNHLDMVKQNNDFLNLEWDTQANNVKHRVDNGGRKYESGNEHYATIPLKGTVVDHGRFNGTTFLLSGYKQASEAGLTSAHLVAKGELNQTKGCKFVKATEEEVNALTKWADVPVELKQLMQSHNASFKETIYGIHSTTLEVRVFIGTESMANEGMSSQSVYQSMSESSNKGLVKGWCFLRTTPGETLEQITERLKAKLLDYYVNSKYRIRCLIGTPVKGGEDVLFVGKRLLQEKGMNPKLAYKEADVPKHTYKGYILKEVPFKLEYLPLL